MGKISRNLLTEILLSYVFNASTPVCHYASMPVRQYASTPVRQYAITPVRQYAITPVRQYGSMPVRQYASTPVRQYASTPVRQYASMPVHHYASTPVRQLYKPQHGETCDLKGRSHRHRSHVYPFHPRYSSLLIHTAPSLASCGVPFTNQSPISRGMILAVCGRIKGQNLNGAHNSLIDVKAQTDILISKNVCGIYQ